MKNRLSKFQFKAPASRRNGRHQALLVPRQEEEKSSLKKRLWEGTKRLRFRKPAWCTRKAWKKAPLTTMNRLLSTVVIVLAVGAPLFLWYDASRIADQFRLPDPQNSPTLRREGKIVRVSKSYLTVAARRRYFRTEVAPSSEPVTVSAAEMPGLAQRYSLLGVLMGEEPQAIVRENDTNTSLFLSKGQRINGYLVEQILEGKIILLQDGQRIELRM
ncbi:MAG: hypothetical protein ACE5HO_04200 [bacterium]